MKPYNINDFRNAFYIEKMFPRNLSGTWGLAVGGNPTEETTSSGNFANQQVFTGMTRKTDKIIGGSTYNYFYAISGKYISRYLETDYDGNSADTFSKSFYTLNNVNTDGVLYADILTTELDNMLFTNKRYLGKTLAIQCNAGMPNASEIVDSAGRNLENLGVKVGQYVLNTRFGECIAIQSITNGSATKDKLTFASAFTATSANWFYVFMDDIYDLYGPAPSHFAGQESVENWSRQIIDFDGEYYIMNGNYLASLDNTEATFDADTLQLKSFMQGICAAVNNNLMIIGGSRYGKGKLLLWDGSSATFTASQDVPQIVRSIVPYKGGWIFMSGSSLYFTDGYTNKEIARIPDTDGMDNIIIAPNGMAIVGENIVMHIYKSSGYTRAKSGVYVYNLNVGTFSYIPINTYAPYTTSTSAVFYDSTNRKFLLSSLTKNSNDVQTNTMHSFDLSATDNSYDTGMMIHFFPASEDIDRSLKLVVARDERVITRANISASIIVAMADAQKVFWYHTTVATADSGTSFTMTGSQAQVGDMIMMMTGTEVGELAFITAITASSGNQIITLDRDIGNTYWAGNIVWIAPFRKVGDFTITTDVDNPYYCNISSGAGIYVLVYLKGARLTLRSLELT